MLMHYKQVHMLDSRAHSTVVLKLVKSLLSLTGVQRIGRICDYLGAIAVPAAKQGYTTDSAIHTQGC